MSNATFRSKVGEVAGGLEVMMCAGFELSEVPSEGDGGGTETFLKHGFVALARTSGGSGGDGCGRIVNADDEMYLSLSDLKLAYTLQR